MANQIKFKIDGEGHIEYNDQVIEYDTVEEVDTGYIDIKAISSEGNEFAQWTNNLIKVSNYGNEIKKTTFYWRGYIFGVSKECVLHDVLCGASKAGFKWALYEIDTANFNPNNPWQSWNEDTLKSIAENTDNQKMQGDVPDKRKGMASNFTDKDINVVLDPDKYYFIAQGRASNDGFHFDVDNIDAGDLVDNNDLIDYWGPDNTADYFGNDDPHVSLRFDGKEPEDLLTLDNKPGHSLRVQSKGPDIGLALKEIDFNGEDSTVYIENNMTITSNFKPQVFNVDIENVSENNGEGYIEIEKADINSDQNKKEYIIIKDNKSLDVAYNDDLYLHAHPENYTQFKGWSNISSSDNVWCSINIKEDKNITAVFEGYYDLDIDMNDSTRGIVEYKLENYDPDFVDEQPPTLEKTINSSAIIKVPKRAEYSLEAIPDTGHNFIKWKGGSKNHYEDPNKLGDEYYFFQKTKTSLNGNESITAEFSNNDNPILVLNSIDIYRSESPYTAIEVTTHSEEVAYEYNQGDIVEIEASEPILGGWSFDSWQGMDNKDYSEQIEDPTSLSTNIEITKDRNLIYALYTEGQHSLTINKTGDPEDKNTIYPHEGTQDYQADKEILLSVDVHEDFNFIEWDGPNSNDINYINEVHGKIILDSDKEFEAVFSQEDYVILSISIDGEGEMNTYNILRVIPNTEVDIKVSTKEDSNYEFQNWEGSNHIIDPESKETSIEIQDSDEYITAVFSPIEKDLIIQTEGPGTTDPAPGTHSHPIGGTVTVEALPYAGADFVEWQGDTDDTESEIIEIDI